MVIQDVYRSFIKNKPRLLITVLLSGFQAPKERWNPPNKAVLVNTNGLGAGIVNATVYKINQFSQVSGMALS